MREFGRIDNFTYGLKYKDINNIKSGYKTCSFVDIIENIECNIENYRFKTFDDFVEAFFPSDFAKSFSEDMDNFDHNQFMNNYPRGKRPFVAFAVMFWNSDFSLTGETGKIAPPEKADNETAQKSMLEFIGETVDKTRKFFEKNKLIDPQKLDKLVIRYYETLYIFKRYDTVINSIKKPKKNISLAYDERLNNAFCAFLASDPYEAFARILITVALETYLFPQREKNSGEFVFLSKVNMDPQLALNVLWFTTVKGGDILTLNSSLASDGKKIREKLLDRDGNDALNLNLANIAFSEGDFEKAYELLLRFNDERPIEEALKSKTYLKGLLKLTECTYKLKTANKAIELLEAYEKYDPVNGSYYRFKFWKEAEDANPPKKGKSLLEKSVGYKNKNAIMDLAKAYAEGDSELDCEKDLKKAFDLLDENVKEGYMRGLRGECYGLMGKICMEDPSLSDGEDYLSIARDFGYEIDSRLFNRAKRIQNKEQQRTRVDFYFTNSRNGANSYFREGLITENAVEIGEDFNLDVFRDVLLNSSDTSLVAAFMSDDEEKNIIDALRFIQCLDELNRELTCEEVSAKKTKISSTEPELSGYLEALGTPKGEKSREFADKVTGIRNATKNKESIKLGQSVMFRNLIASADKISEELGEQAENFKKIFTEYEKLFALPEITKRIIQSVKIFVKGEFEYTGSIIDTKLNSLEDNLYFRIKIVDYDLEAAHDLISERPLFSPYYESGEKDTHVVIFGSGKIAERIITEGMACTVMGEAYSPSFTVIDDDVTQTENTIKGKCIALYDNPDDNFNIKTPEFFSCPLNHPLMQDFVSDKATEPGREKMLDALRRGNYFVVATESDKFNIEFAKKLRSWLLVTDDSFDRHPTIAVLVKNHTIARAAELLEVGGYNVLSWLSSYNLFCFGQEEKIFSAYNLIEDVNEKRAEFIHCSYNTFGYRPEVIAESNFVFESLSSFYRNAYNHESSLCTAYSLPYRMFAAGYRLKGIECYAEKRYRELSEKAEKFKEYSQEQLNVLSKAEHSRWCAFMISRTWRKATHQQFVRYIELGNPKQNLFISKLHPYIVDYSLLDKVHRDLTEKITDKATKEKLINPKDHDTSSLLYTADFLDNYDLFAKIKRR